MKLFIRSAITKFKSKGVVISALALVLLVITLTAYAITSAPPVSSTYDVDRGMTIVVFSAANEFYL